MLKEKKQTIETKISIVYSEGDTTGLSGWSEMMMRGSRPAEPQRRPTTSGITQLDSAAVNQGTYPQAKQVHTQHTAQTHTSVKQPAVSRQLISNARS